MSMKQTLDVINRMEADRIIDRYAIGGAVAAYNYVEPAVTEDLDILVSFDLLSGQSKSGLVTLGPLLAYLKERGYSEFRNEGLLIEGWPVQFLPVANDLDAEALARANDVEIDVGGDGGWVRSRVLRPEHIVATALRVGRPKDRIRIAQFLEEGAVPIRALCDVVARHGLSETWRAFCRQTAIANPCEVESSS